MIGHAMQLIRMAWLMACILLMLAPAHAHAADNCAKYARLVTRLAINANGLNPTVPLYLAQGRQESSCDPLVTAFDKGRGFAQMMDGTSSTVSKICPQIGPPDPYSVVWSINAMICYDNWLQRHVQGNNECERIGAALVAYNGGLGYVKHAQSNSKTPGRWFGETELIPTRQSPKNWAYSRSYPKKIIYGHQKKYLTFGRAVCGVTP